MKLVLPALTIFPQVRHSPKAGPSSAGRTSLAAHTFHLEACRSRWNPMRANGFARLTAHEGIIAETRCILQVQIITRGG
jgi:hypothetical protein